MHSTFASTILVGVLATSVLAAPQAGDSSSRGTVHQVTVGPAFSYTPDSLTAEEGDWIEFTFGRGHDVAQSTFDNPCVPVEGGGVYSGILADGDVWRFQVNSTDPLWLYCSVPGHCQNGMAMVINPPANENTLEAYLSAASNVRVVSETPDEVQGGLMGAASDDDSSNSSTTETSSSATETSGSATETSGSATETSGSATETSSSATATSGSATETSGSGTATSGTASETSSGAGGASESGNAAVANAYSHGLLVVGAVAAGVASFF